MNAGEMAATDRPNARFARLALGALLVLLLASLFFTVHPWFDAKNDSSMYVVTARNWLAGEGITYLGEPFTIRPPGFTVMLAGVIAVFGDSFANFNLFVSLWGVAMCALLFWHQRTRLGVPLAFLTSLALWLNPWVQHLCTQVLSDVPGVALMLAALLFDRWIRGRERPSLALDVALGLFIGLSCYVRTASILLVPAIVLARLTERFLPPVAARERGAAPSNSGSGGAAWLGLAAVAVLPFLVQTPWKLRNAAARTDVAAEQTHIHSYSVAMWHEDPGDPASRRLGWGDVLGRIPEQSRLALTTVGSRMRTDGKGFAEDDPRRSRLPIVGGLFMLCSVITFLRRREAFDFLQLGTYCVVAIYFAYKPRLALPLFVFALPQAVDTLRWILGGLLARAARGASGAKLATAMTAAGVVALAAFDYRHQQGWDKIEQRHEGYMALSRYVENQVGPERVLAMPQGWHLNAFSGRPCYSLLPAMMRFGGPYGFEVIEKHGIDWYAFNKPKPSHKSTWVHLSKRYRLRPTPNLKDWAVSDLEPALPVKR